MLTDLIGLKVEAILSKRIEDFLASTRPPLSYHCTVNEQYPSGKSSLQGRITMYDHGRRFKLRRHERSPIGEITSDNITGVHGTSMVTRPRAPTVSGPPSYKVPMSIPEAMLRASGTSTSTEE